MIHVGTSGWQYDSWKGPFYPVKLPKRAWLAHYTSRFAVVEVNNIFYHLPREGTFDRWREETPSQFLFVLKASRYITHLRRMRDARDSVGLFWSHALRLGDKLGPVLFQFPPHFKADVDLLREFLSVLPPRTRAAFEFRDDSWRRDDAYKALDGAGAAWVVADRPGTQVPLVATGGWAYLRFHQGQATGPKYPREKLRTWADRIASLDARDAFVFFNNDPLAAAPADAAALAELLAERGCEVARPLQADSSPTENLSTTRVRDQNRGMRGGSG